jgi:hypothetical protein
LGSGDADYGGLALSLEESYLFLIKFLCKLPAITLFYKVELFFDELV